MKKLALFAAVIVVCAGAAAAYAAYVVRARAYELFQGYATPEQTVVIERGSSTRAIGEQLVDAGVVRDATTFRIAVWLTGHDRRLQAGEYRFEQPMSAVDV